MSSKSIFSASISHIPKAHIPNRMSYSISGACTFAHGICFSRNVLFFSCSIFLQMKFKLCFKSTPLTPLPSVFEKTSPRGLLHTYFSKSLIYLSFCAISIPCAFLFLCLFLNIAVINFCIFLVRIWVPLGKDKIAPTLPTVYIISSSWFIFSNFWTEQKGRRD